MEIKSILNDILEYANKERDENKIKEVAIKRIANSKVNKKDQLKMSNIIRSKKGYVNILQSIYNLILKYEGEGVINKSLSGHKIR